MKEITIEKKGVIVVVDPKGEARVCNVSHITDEAGEKKAEIRPLK